jgi:catechol 2,3-dioxygenase-like lactoylglutathione lyase family enzyme
MDMKLEVVPLPVTDPDRSLRFYADQVGFVLDHDVRPGNGMRVIQLTPPGSACSIVFGSGMGDGGTPGSLRNLHLVVADIEAARSQLVARGVGVTGVDDLGGIKYAYFEDPDGNSWALQEISRAAVRPDGARKGAS